MEELDEEGWNCLRSAIEKALSDVDDFRIQEGKVLTADILKRIELIKSLSEKYQFEKQRVVTIMQTLQDKMKEWGEIKNIDENRLEQEIIYYLRRGYHGRESPFKITNKIFCRDRGERS